jgi:hypothetical protein
VKGLNKDRFPGYFIQKSPNLPAVSAQHCFHPSSLFSPFVYSKRGFLFSAVAGAADFSADAASQAFLNPSQLQTRRI